MTIQEALRKSNITSYRLAKDSGVPYATVNDIINGKTQLEKCSAENVYRLARTLGISVEELIKTYLIKRCDFENYKSSICHRLKNLGDIDFVINTLENGEIRMYFDRKWYPESLYLLAMLDYICRENDIPLCDEFDDLRSLKLESPVFPAGIRALAAASGDDSVFSQAFDKALPEFKRFNIVENEVRYVI